MCMRTSYLASVSINRYDSHLYELIKIKVGATEKKEGREKDGSAKRF